MKKYILILISFVYCLAGMSQARQLSGFNPSGGMAGFKYYDTLRNLYVRSPLLKVNDSTFGFDSSRYYISTFAPNAGGDSLIITFIGGRRLASVGGGTGGSLTGITGDIVSFSATNTQSNITAVATGQVLVSAGASTKPVYSATPTLTSVTAPTYYGSAASGGQMQLHGTSHSTPNTSTGAIKSDPIYISGASSFLSGSSATSNYFSVVGTLATVNTNTAVGVNIDITGAGSSAQVQFAQLVNLEAGYTGSQTTEAASINNFSAGTGGNYGIVAASRGAATTTSNYGGLVYATGALTNIGMWGDAEVSQFNGATAQSVGVLGLAKKVHASAFQAAGIFRLNASAVSSYAASSALIADNGAEGTDIIDGYKNATLQFSVTNAGLVTNTQSNTTGTGFSASNANASGQSYFAAFGDTYTTQMGQYSSTTTPFAALLASSGWFYSSAPHLVIFDNNASGVIDFAIGSSSTKDYTLDNSTFSPVVTVTNDLGTSSLKWRDIYARGVVGTTTNDNAQAGSNGEYVSSLIALGSAVSLTTVTAANVTSISLTAGDWDVTGSVNFNETGATVAARSAGISSTTATIPSDGSEAYLGATTVTAGEFNSITPARKRFSLSGTTTVYLTTQVTFTAGTVTAFGNITARRIR